VLFDLLSLSGRSTKELAFLLTLSLARILCGHSFLPTLLALVLLCVNFSFLFLCVNTYRESPV
jgi:hypothetical protein